jgi:hypothetical protein
LGEVADLAICGMAVATTVVSRATMAIKAMTAMTTSGRLVVV